MLFVSVKTQIGKNITLVRCMLTLIRRELSLANRTKNMCKNREDLSRKSHIRKSVLLKQHIRKKYSQISYLTKKSNVDYQKNYQNSKIRKNAKQSQEIIKSSMQVKTTHSRSASPSVLCTSRVKLLRCDRRLLEQLPGKDKATSSSVEQGFQKLGFPCTEAEKVKQHRYFRKQ